MEELNPVNELAKTARTLLKQYYFSECALIGEFSGNIEEDQQKVASKCLTWAAYIDFLEDLCKGKIKQVDWIN